MYAGGQRKGVEKRGWRGKARVEVGEGFDIAKRAAKTIETR
jgi:hypothetical protein